MRDFGQSRRGVNRDLVRCYNCHKVGHYISECWSAPRDDPYTRAHLLPRRRNFSYNARRNSNNSSVHDSDRDSNKNQALSEVVTDQSETVISSTILNEGSMVESNIECDTTNTENSISSPKVQVTQSSPAKRLFEKVSGVVDDTKRLSNDGAEVITDKSVDANAFHSMELACNDGPEQAIVDDRCVASDRESIWFNVDCSEKDSCRSNEHDLSLNLSELLADKSEFDVTQAESTNTDNGDKDDITRDLSIEKPSSTERRYTPKYASFYISSSESSEITDQSELTHVDEEKAFDGLCGLKGLNTIVEESDVVKDGQICDNTDIIGEEDSNESAYDEKDVDLNTGVKLVSVNELIDSHQDDQEKSTSKMQVEDEEYELKEPEYAYTEKSFTIPESPPSESGNFVKEQSRTDIDFNCSNGRIFKYKGFTCQARPAPLQRPFSHSLRRQSFANSVHPEFGASTHQPMSMFGSSSRNAFSASAAMQNGLMPSFGHYPMFQPYPMMNHFGMSSGFQYPAEYYANFHQANFDKQFGPSSSAFSSEIHKIHGNVDLSSYAPR